MRKLIPLLFCLTSCIGNGGPGSTSTPAKNGVSVQTTATEATSETTDIQHSSQFNISGNPTVKVYMETSGSMNGYVDKGRSQFQQVIFDFLSNIKNCGLSSAIELNYIVAP